MAQRCYQKASVQVAIVSVIGLIIVTVITVGQQRSDLRRGNQNLETKLEDARSALADVKAERDNYQIRLAPFLAAADRYFQDVPESERLDRLSQKLDSMLETVQDGDRNILLKLTSIETAVGSLTSRPLPSGDRVLSPPVVARLVSSLEPFSGYQMEILCVLNDREAHSLAEQVKSIFVKAGWEVKGVSQAIFNKPVRPLVIEMSKQPALPLQKALLPLFDNLGYAREAALNPSVSEKAIRIIVGTK